MIWFIYFLVLVLVIAAWVGVFLPNFPGPFLIFSAALLLGWFTHFDQVGSKVLWLLFILASLGMILDFIASALGARKFGASRLSAFSAMVGGLLGVIIFNLPGLILGTFVGAFMAELVFGESGFKKAFRSGLGSLLGFLTGVFLQVFIASAMTILLLTAIF